MTTDNPGPLDAEEAARLRSIVEHTQDAIIAKTLEGVVTHWNAAAERIFGWSAAEMIGQPITRIFPPESVVEEAAILERLRAGETIERYEAERVLKDGGRILVALSISPILDGEDQIVGVSKIARDITEERRVRSRLAELQTELLHVTRLNEMGQMAAAFAHELNQPLAAVSNYLSGARALFRRGELESAERGLEMAEAQVKRAGEVVRRLRDFVRRSEGRRAPEDLPRVIEDSLALATLGARELRLRSEVRVAPEASRAVIDRVQIQQVLVNLVRNAVEAMSGSDDGELIVEAQPADGGFVEVAVCDNGPGLAGVVKERLFQPFNSTKSDGMGVGLSLCRTIVEGHGGRIWAEDGPDQGAVFRFTLPRT